MQLWELIYAIPVTIGLVGFAVCEFGPGFKQAALRRARESRAIVRLLAFAMLRPLRRLSWK